MLFFFVKQITQIGDLFLIRVDVIISEAVQTLFGIISLDNLSLTIREFLVLLSEQVFVILQLSNEFFLSVSVGEHLFVLWCQTWLRVCIATGNLLSELFCLVLRTHVVSLDLKHFDFKFLLVS